MKSLNEEQLANEKELRQLKNQQKILLNKKSDMESKGRTHRSIERGGMLESFFPALVPLSNDEVVAFIANISRLPEVQKLVSKLPETEETQ